LLVAVAAGALNEIQQLSLNIIIIIIIIYT